MAKYKVTFDRDTCIGVLSCIAVDPEHWEAAKGEPKVNLKEGSYNEETGFFEAVFSEEEYEALKDAEEVCPVNAIKVEKIEE